MAADDPMLRDLTPEMEAALTTLNPTPAQKRLAEAMTARKLPGEAPLSVARLRSPTAEYLHRSSAQNVHDAGSAHVPYADLTGKWFTRSKIADFRVNAFRTQHPEEYARIVGDTKMVRDAYANVPGAMDKWFGAEEALLPAVEQGLVQNYAITAARLARGGHVPPSTAGRGVIHYPTSTKEITTSLAGNDASAQFFADAQEVAAWHSRGMNKHRIGGDKSLSGVSPYSPDNYTRPITVMSPTRTTADYLDAKASDVYLTKPGWDAGAKGSVFKVAPNRGNQAGFIKNDPRSFYVRHGNEYGHRRGVATLWDDFMHESAHARQQVPWYVPNPSRPPAGAYFPDKRGVNDWRHAGLPVHPQPTVTSYGELPAETWRAGKERQDLFLAKHGRRFNDGIEIMRYTQGQGLMPVKTKQGWKWDDQKAEEFLKNNPMFRKTHEWLRQLYKPNMNPQELKRFEEVMKNVGDAMIHGSNLKKKLPNPNNFISYQNGQTKAASMTPVRDRILKRAGMPALMRARSLVPAFARGLWNAGTNYATARGVPSEAFNAPTQPTPADSWPTATGGPATYRPAGAGRFPQNRNRFKSPPKPPPPAAPDNSPRLLDYIGEALEPGSRIYKTTMAGMPVESATPVRDGILKQAGMPWIQRASDMSARIAPYVSAFCWADLVHSLGRAGYNAITGKNDPLYDYYVFHDDPSNIHPFPEGTDHRNIVTPALADGRGVSFRRFGKDAYWDSYAAAIEGEELDAPTENVTLQRDSGGAWRFVNDSDEIKRRQRNELARHFISPEDTITNRALYNIYSNNGQYVPRLGTATVNPYTDPYYSRAEYKPKRKTPPPERRQPKWVTSVHDGVNGYRYLNTRYSAGSIDGAVAEHNAWKAMQQRQAELAQQARVQPTQPQPPQPQPQAPKPPAPVTPTPQPPTPAPVTPPTPAPATQWNTARGAADIEY
jgi:hypothetical protein